MTISGTMSHNDNQFLFMCLLTVLPELRKNRFESEGSEKYKEVNNNIKRCTKSAKENWIREQCSEFEENLRRHTNSWKTWPLWNRGKQLLSTIVQENASQKSDTCWTDGQNTALSCTATRSTEIYQYWTVPRQTQKTTTPSFTKKWGFSSIIERM